MAVTAVTPAGVRDGDPDALGALCERRGPAVLAYCEIIAGAGPAASAAAADAFAGFRSAVVATADLDALNPEALLINATRHAAARHAGSALADEHSRVPALLAARADRSISLADNDWLSEHLAHCPTCRAPVERFENADSAYLDPPATPLAADLTAVILTAMTAAAPVRDSTVQTPAPPVEDDRAASAAPLPVPSSNGHAAPADWTDSDETAQVEQPAAAHDLPAVEQPVANDLPAVEQPPARGEPGLHRRPRAARPIKTARSPRASGSRGSAGARMPRPPRAVASRVAAGRGFLRPSFVLPIVLVVVAIIVALTVAGVFGGGEPASVPQSFAPRTSERDTGTATTPVVVVPGAAAAAAAAVERAKARARSARRRAAEAKKRKDAKPANDAPSSPSAPSVAGEPATRPPAPPAPAREPAGSTGKPEIESSGTSGAEELPPAQDTSTVPDLAPPAEPAAPPG